jgi:Tfp pilus assembly protein PilV
MRRRGVSLVEVLFAMMIALFGLAGVLAIFPLAARQAADSYSLNQATNGAFNAANASAASKEMIPSEDSPWVCDDDYSSSSLPAGNSAYDPPFNNYSGFSYKPFKRLSDLYDGLYQKRVAELTAPANQHEAIRRTVIGQAYCYDPLYLSSVNQANWTSQAKPWNDYSGGIIRRSRMPFFSEALDPTTFDGSGNFVVGSNYLSPRLIRASGLANLNPSIAAAPLNMASSNARMSSVGDLIPAAIQMDKSFGALREFEGVDSGSLLSAGVNSDLSWFATIVPMESKSLEIPNQFVVSVVIVKKRDRTFDVPDGSVAITTLPVSERIASVTAQAMPYSITPPAMSNGSLLNATLHFDSRTDSSLRVGDYVMLSRYVLWNLPDSFSTTPPLGRKYVHRHAWYRVVAVGELTDTIITDSQKSRDVVLQGRAWDYPDLVASVNMPATTSILPADTDVPTVATLIENVVAVYEYPINIVP